MVNCTMIFNHCSEYKFQRKGCCDASIHHLFIQTYRRRAQFVHCNCLQINAKGHYLIGKRQNNVDDKKLIENGSVFQITFVLHEFQSFGTWCSFLITKAVLSIYQYYCNHKHRVRLHHFAYKIIKDLLPCLFGY